MKHFERGKCCDSYKFMPFMKGFACHFGCNFYTELKSDMAEHLVTRHAESDLLLWGYKRNVLKQLMTKE